MRIGPTLPDTATSSSDLPKAPRPLKSVADTGLDQAFIQDLVLKHLLHLRSFKMGDVAERVKLPVSILDQIFEELRNARLIEVQSATNYTSSSYLFKLTELGRERGQEALALCRYAGPAPVTLEHYARMVEQQTIRNACFTENALEEAFSHLVVNETVRKRLGPAIISGQAIFIHGPSGNGKTSIAEAIGRMLPDTVYLPYAVLVGNQIVTVFDPVNHFRVDAAKQKVECDNRWLLVKRPVIITGGELSLKMLDLTFNPSSKYHDASLQMKANNGLLIVDDFGRQQAEPSSILNRWLIPLDRGVDYMTLETGIKFVIPFDMLVIFSTNLDPRQLVDEAFLRRLKYKIKVDRPSDEEFMSIFQKVCDASGVAFRAEAFSYLIEHCYGTRRIRRNACHPKDLLELIVTRSRFLGVAPQLTVENVAAACADYFVDV